MELKRLKSALEAPSTVWTNMEKHLSDPLLLLVIRSDLSVPLATFSWNVRNVTKSEVERGTG